MGELKTVAQRISERLNNDGTNFNNFGNIIREYGRVYIEVGKGEEAGNFRHVFWDESVIVECESRWGIEGLEPWSWASSE